MKTILLIFFLSIMVAAGFSGVAQDRRSPITASWETLQPPVYTPKRLKYVLPPVAIEGKVIMTRLEQDGDYHLTLALWDNRTIIAEIVCVGKPGTEAARKACIGYTNHVIIPKVGQRVIVEGPVVWDSNHSWAELHPVSKVTILP